VASGCGGGSGDSSTAPPPAAAVEPSQGGATKARSKAAKPPASPEREATGKSSSGGDERRRGKLPRIIAAPGQSQAEARRVVERLLQGKRPKPGSGSSKIRDTEQALRELVNGEGRKQKPGSPGGQQSAGPSKVIQEVLNGAR
jgi:hypothetical protein